MDDSGKSSNYFESNLFNENPKHKKIKITIAIFIIAIILLIAATIVSAILYFTKETKKEIQKENDKKQSQEEYLLEINGFKEKWYDIFGNRTINISYAENNIIPNTYKKGGPNYIPDIEEPNGGKDYTKYDTNVYDLYIPYSSLYRKDKYNGIMLFVHGGGFENNTKEETEAFAERFAKLGYITANIEYTNSLDKYKQRGFFRILDEMTACIKSIKNELKSQGFNESKLELSLYGISAGGQLILTYAFSDKNKLLPIKYLVNCVGVITLDPFYWYQTAKPNVTLDHINNYTDIEEAIKNKIYVQIDWGWFVLYMLNLMTGKKYTEKEMGELVVNNVIQTEHRIYKDLMKIGKYGFPKELIGNNTIPMLCLYGGNDGLVINYGFLNKHYIENGEEKNIDIVYMKYADHSRFHNGIERDIIAMKEMHKKMIDYAKKYFTHD